MYRKILVPVDLAHLDSLERALQVASDLGRHYETEVCYISVTQSAPSSVAKSPEDYEQKLEAFANEQAKTHGRPVSAKVLVSADPAVELDDKLIHAIDDVGADLVVMGTHHHGKHDIIMPSNGSHVAKETNASIFLVRP
ncbi:nucleotide-binding universal stress UspA family protein [Halospina denitrificans]|uniref:Nucleotide-binding universal stress UspA family protein n=1 Tax=Halospina denitrificans TaxID=332522 RepID=A0A4R7K3K9_9GAMM|nr:universal stress protein [Halospina denitrificans]TDT44189.1 nucleotide-binding universal stress UspA family protein [Halospina denitrificans]